MFVSVYFYCPLFSSLFFNLSIQTVTLDVQGRFINNLSIASTQLRQIILLILRNFQGKWYKW